MTDHLKGHKSLAEMVSTHIEVWRDALKLKRDKAYDTLHGDEYRQEMLYLDHENKALADIEKACELEMANEHSRS